MRINRVVFLRVEMMSELEKKKVSSRCTKCGGYVDHVAMACIMCGTNSQPYLPKSHKNKDNIFTHSSHQVLTITKNRD